MPEVQELAGNYFSEVPFPLRVDDRYLSVTRREGDSTSPEVRIYRWHPQLRLALEEGSRPGNPITWETDEQHGAVRIAVRGDEDRSPIEGYAVGGPDDGIVVVLTQDEIRVIRGDEVVLGIRGNEIGGYPVGVTVQTNPLSATLGGQLPPDFAIGEHRTNETINLAEFSRSADGPARIQHTVFEHCRVEGPAILIPIDGMTVSGNDFDLLGSSLESLVWVLPVSNSSYGAIQFIRCGLVRCSIHQVAFGVPAEHRDQFISMLTGHP